MAENMIGSVDDLAAYVGEPISDEMDKSRATMLLRHASILVRDEARQPFDSKVPEKVLLIVLAVASRVYLNPEFFGNERLDDWGAGGRPIEEYGMHLTATEKRVLSGFRPHRTGVGSIATTRVEPGDRMAGFVPTAPPGVPQTPIPWW